MEHDRPEKIVIICEQLIKLLNENDEAWWAGALKDLMNNYINLTRSKTKKEAVLLIEKIIIGGMGSFGDLVLHKDGIPLDEENDQLKDLRTKLFKECEFILYGRLSVRILDTFEELSFGVFEAHDEYTCEYYRISSSEAPLGKFFVGDEEDFEEIAAQKKTKTALPIRPVINTVKVQKRYKIITPLGTIVRAGVLPDPSEETEHAQCYIDKPWRIQGLKIKRINKE